jgi:hypothetical protein
LDQRPVQFDTASRAAHRQRSAHLGGILRLSGLNDRGPLPRDLSGPDNPPRYEDVTTADYVRVLREDAHRAGRPAVAAETAQRLKSN